MLRKNGCQCVVRCGVTDMLLLCVDNLDIMEVSIMKRCYYMQMLSVTLFCSVSSADYGGMSQVFIEISSCIGNETHLADCTPLTQEWDWNIPFVRVTSLQ